MNTISDLVRKNKGYRVIRSLFLRCFYCFNFPFYGINKVKRENLVIVSVTSYTPKLKALVKALRSILNQKVKPDKVIVYLGNDVQDKNIPQSLKRLSKYGVEIRCGYENMMPHKKYLFAMQEYPEALIITIDDDGIYDRLLIKTLLESYQKYPDAVSSCRVHRILFENKLPKKYNQWDWDYTQETSPRFDLIATGVGGVLYPATLFPKETFNVDKIKKISLYADDLWLKVIEVIAGIPVVWAKTEYCHPIALDKVSNSGLNEINVGEGRNDEIMNALWSEFSLKQEMFMEEYHEQ